MDAKTLSALRPRDDSSTALRAALETLSRERAAASQRLDTARANRRAALTDLAAGPKDIAAFEQQARDAELELERLDLIAPDLEVRIAAAQQREDIAAKQQAVDNARADFARAVEALRAALPDYQKHAEAIARICELDRAEQATLLRFRNAVVRARPNGVTMSAGDPDPGIETVDAVLAERVRLPGLPGQPVIWDGRPVARRPSHYAVEASIYGQQAG